MGYDSVREVEAECKNDLREIKHKVHEAHKGLIIKQVRLLA